MTACVKLATTNNLSKLLLTRESLVWKISCVNADGSRYKRAANNRRRMGRGIRPGRAA